MKDAPIAVRRITALADCPELALHWAQLRAASGDGDPFLSFDWLRIWLDAFADSATPWFLLAEQQGRVLGIAPLVLRRAAARIKVRRLGFPVDDTVGPLRYDFLIDSASRLPVLDALFAELARRRHEWDLLQLDGLRADSPTRDFLMRGAGACASFCARSEHTLPGALVMDTPDDANRFLRSRSRHFRKRIGTDQTRLAAAGRTDVVLARHGEEVRAALPAVHAILCRHFGCDNMAQLSSADRRVIAYFDRVIEVFAPDGRVDLRLLRIDGQPVACLLSLIGGDCAYPYLTKFDPAWRDTSPGRNVILQFITHAAQAGYRRIDFLSDWEYLRRFTTQHDAYHGVAACNRRAWSRLLAFYSRCRETRRPRLVT